MNQARLRNLQFIIWIGALLCGGCKKTEHATSAGAEPGNVSDDTPVAQVFLNGKEQTTVSQRQVEEGVTLASLLGDEAPRSDWKVLEAKGAGNAGFRTNKLQERFGNHEFRFFFVGEDTPAIGAFRVLNDQMTEALRNQLSKPSTQLARIEEIHVWTEEPPNEPDAAPPAPLRIEDGDGATELKPEQLAKLVPPVAVDDGQEKKKRDTKGVHYRLADVLSLSNAPGEIKSVEIHGSKGSAEFSGSIVRSGMMTVRVNRRGSFQVETRIEKNGKKGRIRGVTRIVVTRGES